MNSGAMPGPLSSTDEIAIVVRLEQAHLHPAVLRRELDRIAQQVPDDLLQAIGVARRSAARRDRQQLQADLLGIRRGLHRLGGGPDDAAEVDVPERRGGSCRP